MTEFTERERTRLLLLIREEQQHTQSLRMLTPRTHVGYHLMLDTVSSDLANVVDKLTKG